MEIGTIIRPELLDLSAEQTRVLLPFLAVIAGSLLAVILSVVKTVSPKWSVFIVSVATGLVGSYFSFGLLGDQSVRVFNDMMVSDSFSNFFNLVFLASVIFTILTSFRYLDKEQTQHPEYYVLLLLSALGMMLMVSSLDLIVFFISLELMSLSVYTLVGFRRSDRKSNEAAMKYFIMGGAASAVLLYGTALLYGVVGSTNIIDVLAFVQSGAALPPLFTLGMWLVVIGFLFKVACVPFHMWTPDVYEGAPAPITGFMTTGVKAASFATFVRVFISLGYGKGLEEAIEANIHDIIWICSVLTMIVGNIVALNQTNLKRMLAYSSIAHTGYILVGLIAGPQSDEGYSPIMVYLVAYAVMNLGAFIVLTVLAARKDEGLNLHDMSGVAQRHPWLAFSMAVFLFSMAGIPPTAGFVAKYMLFYSAIQGGEILLVVIAVLCSAISVYYYLRVLVFMYMKDPVGSAANRRIPIWSAAALASMVVLTFQVGVLPSALVEAAKKAVSSL